MKRKSTLLVLLALLFAASNVSAQLFGQLTFYVSGAHGNDANGGLQPNNAFKNLRHAIAVMRQSSVKEINILVDNSAAQAPYDESNGFDPTVSFLMSRNETNQDGKMLRVLGGYNFDAGTRDMYNNPSIITSGVHNIIIGNVTPAADSIVIEGFYIRSGSATDDNFYYYTPTLPVHGSIGGGIVIQNCNNSKISIRNCEISGNAAASGGGMYITQSSGPVVQNVSFTANSAYFEEDGFSSFGGAVYVGRSEVKFLNCFFDQNLGNNGAAIYQANQGSQTLTISNCSIMRSDLYGTAPGFVIIPHPIEKSGGGRIEITNTLFFGNDSHFDMRLDGPLAEPGNPSSGEIFVSNVLTDNYSVKYGPGPINAIGDARVFLFLNDNQPDHCFPNNPLLDQGNNSFPGALLATDITGRPRKVGSAVDIGAFENQTAIQDYYKDNDGDGFGGAETIRVRCKPDGFVDKTGDCTDDDNEIYPGAPEICDGKDNDCDGQIDEDLKKAYLPDADGDGYGQKGIEPTLSCTPIEGYVLQPGDCDDNDPAVHPQATELCDGKDNDCDGQIDEGVTKAYWPDADGDGYGQLSVAPVLSCTPIAGYVTGAGDCDDNDPAVHDHAIEICDGKDNDCDGQIDNHIPGPRYYPDNDGDGHGDKSFNADVRCPLTGYVTSNDDCNDNDPSVYPGASELCDGKDNNCDGKIDEGVRLEYYIDADGDGWGTGAPVESCVPLQGYALRGGDCNDNDNTIYPNAPELCDGKDNNCNGQFDENIKVNYYVDADGDGFGSSSNPILSCIPVAGRVTKSGDCNDGDNTIYPDAPELCDNKDNDCNGQTDEGITANYYLDADGDGFGKTSDVVVSCISLNGRVTKAGDCNDNDNTIYPGAPEICDGKDNDCDPKTDDPGSRFYYRDADGDGHGTNVSPVLSCQPIDGYATVGNDCNDNDNTIYPGAPEICDGKDNDCNGQTDDVLMQKLYRDADGDGYGNSQDVILSCSVVEGRVLDNSDCNDADNTVHPFADELCDGKDNNCNGQTDENAGVYYYLDADSDGFGNNNDFITSCTPISGRVIKGNDCNDADNTIYPGAAELCDNKDNDCDGQTDEGVTKTNYYLDADGDGFGKTSDVVSSCTPISGRVTNANDCDDEDANIHPGATEICDGKDNDCDGQTDEGTTKTNYYLDADGDGFGKTSDVVSSCTPVEGRVIKSGDCNDSDRNIYPGASEICDGKDNDCDGQTDEGTTKTNYYLDADGDGFGKTSDVVSSCTPVAGRVIKSGDCNDNDKTIYPNAPEICDGKDNDCDGQTDENVTKKIYFRDADGDGYGYTWDVVLSCSPVAGRVLIPGDCKDNDNTVYPGATEICDGKDNDCDGQTDEGTTKTNYYRDADGDGFGKTSDVVSSCTPVAGRVTKNGDCNDSDRNIYPGATEIRNGKDDDCDGQVDENTCVNPGSLSTTSITRTTALLKWTASNTPTQWQVRYRKLNADWTVLPVAPGSNRSLELRNLKCNKQYEWQVRSICNGTANAYSQSASFTTITCNTATRSGEGDNQGEDNDEVTKTWIETKVWPNPTNGAFTLSVKLDKAQTHTASIKIIDLSGRVVYQENTTIVNGQLQKQMNMPPLAGAGIYVVVVTTNTGTKQFKIEYLK